MHRDHLIGNRYFVPFFVFYTESVMLGPRFIPESVFYTQSLMLSPSFIPESVLYKSSNIGKTTTTNQCRRVPELWRPGSVKIKRYYTKNGRLIPTAKREKEKVQYIWANILYLPFNFTVFFAVGISLPFFVSPRSPRPKPVGFLAFTGPWPPARSESYKTLHFTRRYIATRTKNKA